MWCYKGKHEVESSGFQPSQIKLPNGRICKSCSEKQRKRKYEVKRREKKVDDFLNNMFFNFKGL